MMNVYFLTGSSSGIGLALGKELLKDENNVVVGVSRGSKIAHDRYRHIQTDFKDIDKVLSNTAEIFKLQEEADTLVLINNAGTLGEVSYLGELSSKDIPEIYHVNIVAPAILMNEFIKAFSTHPAKKLILNISSGVASYPVDGWAGYCATKAALNMISEVASVEQTKRDSAIKIHALAPGVVDTAMQEKIRKVDSKNFSGVKKFVEFKEKGVLSSPELAAENILHFLKNQSNFQEVVQDVRKF